MKRAAARRSPGSRLSISPRRRSISTSKSRTGPSAEASQESSARRASLHAGSSRSRAARRMARRRRVATRSWCSSSVSSPKRVPGSWARSSATCRASATRTCSSAGAPRGGSAGSSGKNPIARKAFDRPSPGDAPASSRARPRSGSAPAPSPSSASASSSTNDSRTRRPSRIATRSTVTSATARPSTCARMPVRRVRRTTACSRPRPRRTPTRRSARSAGGPAGPPGVSSSSRSPLPGSFSCHRPLRFSTRRRRVTPARARARSGVSKYVEVSVRGSSGSPGSSGREKSAGIVSFSSRSRVERGRATRRSYRRERVGLAVFPAIHRFATI